MEGVLRRAGILYSYVDLYESVPRVFHPQQLAGLIVLGGPMNVDETDQYPFLATEIQWLRRAIDAQLPILGICLGSQLLAKALGAAVYPAGAKEIGWQQVRRSPEADHDLIFRHWGQAEVVFQWHGDTFDLPAGAVGLAESDICKQQAFRYGKTAYGMQFHLEMTSEMLDTWLSNPQNCLEIDSLEDVDPRQIRLDAPQRLPSVERLGELLFGEFATLCHQQA